MMVWNPGSRNLILFVLVFFPNLFAIPTVGGEFFSFEHSDHVVPSSKKSDGVRERKSSEASVTGPDGSGAADKETCEICEIKLHSVLDILTTDGKEELLEKTQHTSAQQARRETQTSEAGETEGGGSIWSFLGLGDRNKEKKEGGEELPKDSDFDGIPDYLDDDNDNDGILDIFESEHVRVEAGSDLFYDFQANEFEYEEASDDEEKKDDRGVLREEEKKKIPDYLDDDDAGNGISDILEKEFTEDLIDTVKEENLDDIYGETSDDKVHEEGTAYEPEMLPAPSSAPDKEAGSTTDERKRRELKDSDKDGIPDIEDDDDDNDGIPDYLDDDDDGDGILDFLEEEFVGDLPTYAEFEEVPDIESGDSKSSDEVSSDEAKEVEKAKSADSADLKDSDNDGVPDVYDDDDDNDGIPDYLDDDDDGDGILDFLEEEFSNDLPKYAADGSVAEESAEETDEDSENVKIETETIDNDIVEEDVIKAEQEPLGSALKDSDNDGIPDVEDDDDDNDGVPDYLDDDDDGDGILDFLEDEYQPQQLDDVKSFQEILNGEVKVEEEEVASVDLKDSDSDGVPDVYDDDDDNDGIPDYLDDDDDGDGILDFLEKEELADDDENTDYLKQFYSDGVSASSDEPTELREVSADVPRDEATEEAESADTKKVDEAEEASSDTEKDKRTDEDEGVSAQKDSDNDGIPDDLDDDDDNDGIPDYLDDDDDGDGILDIFEDDSGNLDRMFFNFNEYEKNSEEQPFVEDQEQLQAPPTEDVSDDEPSLEKRSVESAEKEVETETVTILEEKSLQDSDNDGIPDIEDDDDDNDGIPDYLDDDDDGDGILDFLEEEFSVDLPKYEAEESQEIIFSKEFGDETAAEEKDWSETEIGDDAEDHESETNNDSDKVEDDATKAEQEPLGSALKDSDNDGIPDVEDDDDDNDGVPDYLDDDDDGDGILDFLEDEFTGDLPPYDIQETLEITLAEDEVFYEGQDKDSGEDGTETKEDKNGDDDDDDDHDHAEQNDDEGDTLKTSSLESNLKDSDNDGIPDVEDDDDDNDGIPDYLDDDDDGDGILDFLEGEFADDLTKAPQDESFGESLEREETQENEQDEQTIDPTVLVIPQTHQVAKQVEEGQDARSIPDRETIKETSKAFGEDEEKDSDNDGIPDYLDDDNDNGDGILDILEREFSQPDVYRRDEATIVPNERTTESVHGDQEAAKADDEDQEADVSRTEESESKELPGVSERVSDKDSDLDGIPDYLDDDDDNDGIPDYLDDDDDGDGILDFLEDDYQPNYVYEFQSESIDEGKSDVEDTTADDVLVVEDSPKVDKEFNARELESLESDDSTQETAPENGDERGIDEAKDSDMDGIPDYIDDDDDNDGIPDYLDDDDDGDGILDFLEDDFAVYGAGLYESLKNSEHEVETEPESNQEADSTPEQEVSDEVPAADDDSKSKDQDEPRMEKEGEEKEEEEEKDSDGDGIPDSIDDDDDNDGTPDVMDDDDDGNGVPDFLEEDYVVEKVDDEFEYIENETIDILVEEREDHDDHDRIRKELIDSDLDGIPDYLDDDDDNDGIPDYLDEDDDGDGILDFLEDDYVEETTAADEVESIDEGIGVDADDDVAGAGGKQSDEENDLEPFEEEAEFERAQPESVIQDEFSFATFTKYFFQSESPNESKKQDGFEQRRGDKILDHRRTFREFYSVPPSQSFTPEERERFLSRDNPPEGINIDLITDSDGDGIPDFRDEDDDDDGVPDHYDPEFKLPLIVKQHQPDQAEEAQNITVEENKVLLSELIHLLSNSPEEDLNPALKSIDTEQTCQLSGILKNIERSVSKSSCDSVERGEASSWSHSHGRSQAEHRSDLESEESFDLWGAVKLFVWGSNAKDEKVK